MKHATRHISARLRSFTLYELHLAGEVLFPGWSMCVDRDALTTAISAGRPGGRIGWVVLVVCERGLSVRSCLGARDIAGRGFWASPLEVEAGRLRQALRREGPGRVQLEFAKGRLRLNRQSMPAREI